MIPDTRPIVLIEDDPDDAELTMRALARARISNPLLHLDDGAKALDWLLGRGAYQGRDLTEVPALVLLDLKLPRVSGIEVLAAVRKDPRLQGYPVVILTSSGEEEDLQAAYREGANSYIRKPVDFTEFANAVAQLGLYWLVLNRVPERPQG
jgi:two-component system response regulator